MRADRATGPLAIIPKRRPRNEDSKKKSFRLVNLAAISSLHAECWRRAPLDVEEIDGEAGRRNGRRIGYTECGTAGVATGSARSVACVVSSRTNRAGASPQRIITWQRPIVAA